MAPRSRNCSWKLHQGTEYLHTIRTEESKTKYDGPSLLLLLKKMLLQSWLNGAGGLCLGNAKKLFSLDFCGFQNIPKQIQCFLFQQDVATGHGFILIIEAGLKHLHPNA